MHNILLAAVTYKNVVCKTFFLANILFCIGLPFDGIGKMSRRTSYFPILSTSSMQYLASVSNSIANPKKYTFSKMQNSHIFWFLRTGNANLTQINQSWKH